MKKRIQRLAAVGLLLFAQVATCIVAPIQARAVTNPPVTLYSVPAPTGSSLPEHITVGSDGNLWFTEWNGRKISRITPDGVITQYSLPAPPGGGFPTPLGALASGIVLGTDGAIWFGETKSDGSGYKIGRITTGGVLTEYPLPAHSASSGINSVNLALDANGTIWFTEKIDNGSVGYIGKISYSGQVTEYSVAGFQAFPLSLGLGPDGALWFGKQSFSGYRMGRMTTDGVFSEYTLTSGGAVGDIVAGPDGALWFAGLSTSPTNGKYIGRMTTSGTITNVYPVGDNVTGMMNGPDGAIWFNYGDKIGKISTNGVIEEYSIVGIPLPNGGGITTGPDASIWFTKSRANKVGRLGLQPADITSPIVNGLADRGANVAGWYDDNVTITWSATDPEPSSGVPTTPVPTLADLEGTNTYASGQSCDPAGNCATGSLALSIDKTTPTISYEVSQAPNGVGWNSNDVVVTFTCDDTVSGVASCTNPVMVGEGANQTIVGTAVDYAGNSKSVQVTLDVDETDPTITYSLSHTPNSADWNNSDVTVTFDCQDAVSGVASCSGPVTISEGVNQNVTGTAIDLAGNTATVSVELNVDKTLPTISYATSSVSPVSSSGWFNNDVTVTFDCDDGLSGLLSCSAPVTLSSEGASQAVTGTAEDVAGNVNSATAEVSIDKTAPVVVSQNFSTDPKSVSQTSVTLTAQIADNLSGVGYVEYFDPVLQTWQPMLLDDTTATALVNTSFMLYPAGSYTFMVRAWDKADNQSQTASIVLHVYNPGGGHVTGTGFIDLEGQGSSHNLPAVQGSNIKAKFDFNVRYTDPLAVVPTGTNTFSYGQSCNSPNNTCFKIATDSFDWLMVPTSNDSAMFQGLATLTLAGQSLGSGYPVRISLIDGGSQADAYTITVYPIGSDPDTATPIYDASGPTNGGNLLIHP